MLHLTGHIKSKMSTFSGRIEKAMDIYYIYSSFYGNKIPGHLFKKFFDWNAKNL